MIEELLDQYSIDEFDDLLIEIIKQMKERKENNEEGIND
jgi:hypothetical protein